MNAPATRLEAHEAHKARRLRMRSFVPRLVAPVAVVPPDPVEPALPMVRMPDPPKPWVPRTRSDRIVDLVARHYGLTAEQVRSRHMGRNVTWARQVAMVLLVRVADRTNTQAAIAVARCDHSTTWAAMRTVDRRVAEDPAVAAEFEGLAGAVREMCRS